jgi:hypothetical protein
MTPVRAGRAVPPKSAVPPKNAERVIQIRLQDGSRIQARIAPTVAQQRDLTALAASSAKNERRTAQVLRRQRREIARVRSTNQALTQKLEALRSQTDRVLIGLVRDVTVLERHVGQVAAQTRSALSKKAAATAARQLKEMRALSLRSQLQSVTNVVNSLQAAAFGEKGSLVTTNNLILAGNQLFWGLLEPVLRQVGALNPSSATVIAAVAPVGTLLTGQLLLGDRQHERYVTGVATFDPAVNSVSIPLRGQVAENMWPQFRDRTDVVVTATPLEGGAPFQTIARVDQGNLRINLMNKTALFTTPVRVAWTVDTAKTIG